MDPVLLLDRDVNCITAAAVAEIQGDRRPWIRSQIFVQENVDLKQAHEAGRHTGEKRGALQTEWRKTELDTRNVHRAVQRFSRSRRLPRPDFRRDRTKPGGVDH